MDWPLRRISFPKPLSNPNDTNLANTHFHLYSPHMYNILIVFQLGYGDYAIREKFYVLWKFEAKVRRRRTGAEV
jgi:hypothetical protein